MKSGDLRECYLRTDYLRRDGRRVLFRPSDTPAGWRRSLCENGGLSFSHTPTSPYREREREETRACIDIHSALGDGMSVGAQGTESQCVCDDDRPCCVDMGLELIPARATSFPLRKLFHVARLADAFSGCALNGFGCLKYMTPTRADLVRRIRTLRLLRASATNGTTMLAAVECVVAKLDKQPWKLPCDPECGRPIHL